MLSFIYRLASEFERDHGIAPNLLYLSPAHLDVLKGQMECDQIDELVHHLGMEVVISREAVHPHVVWTHLPWQRMAV